MRDYRGVSYDRIDDLKSREAISTIDEFLRQLSFSVANLEAGRRTDASGTIITAPPVLDDYFYLPGRPGGQIGHGGSASGDPLTLVSNPAHDNKILLGAAGTSAYDEPNDRLGLGTAAPETPLHVRGNPQPGVILASSDITAPGADPDWYLDGTSTYWEALQLDDGDSKQVSFQQNFVGSQDFVVGLDSAIPAATPAWTMTLMARRIGTIHASMAISVIMRRDDGQASDAVSLPSPATMSTSWTEYTLEFNSWGGATAQTPNSVRFNGSVSSNPGGAVINITYMGIADSAGSSGPALTLIERTETSVLPYSIWRDESDITVASVTSTGAGQFQNVLLEDPGAGVGTVTLKAPTGVTNYTLTLPADDGAANDLLTTNGSGTLSWAALDADLTELAALTRTRGDLIVGGASAWVDLAVGAANSFLKSDGTDPAWALISTLFANPTTAIQTTASNGTAITAMRSDAAPAISLSIDPTWNNIHTWTRGSDATSILINSFSDAGTSALLNVRDTSTVRLFDVAPSGTVSISNTTSALTGVKFQVRAPTVQASNIAQVVQEKTPGNNYTAWSIGSTGINVFGDTGANGNSVVRLKINPGATQSADLMQVGSVFTLNSAGKLVTTLAPQIDIASAAVGYLWSATDVDGNGVWTAPPAGVTPAALTRTDDTNVTLTLGGTPTTALLQAASITAGWTGQLSLARGGTNNTTGTATVNANLTGHVTSVGNAAVLGSFTSAQLLAALTDETGSGANVFATSPILVTPLLGTPTSGVLTNCTGLPIDAGTINTLPRARGGTGLTAAGTTGNVLTSDGTDWTSAAPAAGAVDVARTWATLQKFPDDKLRVVGSADNTKMAAWEVDGFDTATTRTFTLPNLDTPLVGSASDHTITGLWTFGDAATGYPRFIPGPARLLFSIDDAAVSGFGVEANLATLTDNRTYTFPNGSGTLETNTSTSIYTNKTLSGATNFIRCGTTQTRFAKLTSTTVYFTVDAGALTTTQVLSVPNATGMLMIPEATVTHISTYTGNEELITHNGEIVVL